jgi:deazaflavin-dependent oxidoreductase (nitroreductase family)
VSRRDQPFLPPRWFIRLFWKLHRGVYRVTGGRVGLWSAKPDKWGTMRVTTVGRRSGQERSVIIGYLEDGPNVTTLAMNGWGGADPAWWLNLQAHPQARIHLKDGARHMVAHEASGEERERLWARWRSVDQGLDEYAALRSKPTAVVVFEPAV